MRDAGALKGASRSRRGVVGVLLLVGVVVAAAALLGPSDASDDDASTSSGVTLAKGAAAWARATERPDATSTGGVSGRSSDPGFPSDAVGSLASTRCVADPAHAPKMTEREMATVLKYVSGSFVGATWRDGEARYLEWGGGGSTSAFGTRALLTHTVEHNKEWCRVISEWPEMRCMEKRQKWRLFCHDANVVLKKWGYPDDGSGVERYRSRKPKPDSEAKADLIFAEHMRAYVQAPGKDQFANVTSYYDVVLLDGRMRSACAWSAVPFLKPDSVVLWHDFGKNAWRNIPLKNEAVVLDSKTREPTWHGDRLYSKAAGRLFDKIEHVDNLAVFRLKPAVWQQTRWLE
jgi:hypothetical protein